MNHKRILLEEIKEPYLEVDKKEQIHYLKNVLRIKSKDEIVIIDGKGWEYRAEVKKIFKNNIKLEIKNKFYHNPKRYRLNLYQSLLKNPKMDLLIQKATELNVDRFIPIVTQRSIRYNIEDERIKNKLNHWKNISISSTLQCGRFRLMEIEEIEEIREKVKDKSLENSIVFWEEEKNLRLKEAIKDFREIEDISLFVGPEGGFTREEIEFLRERGVISVGLGEKILRSETASIFGISVIQYERGLI